jgi:hypothetical protein
MQRETCAARSVMDRSSRMYAHRTTCNTEHTSDIMQHSETCNVQQTRCNVQHAHAVKCTTCNRQCSLQHTSRNETCSMQPTRWSGRHAACKCNMQRSRTVNLATDGMLCWGCGQRASGGSVQGRRFGRTGTSQRAERRDQGRYRRSRGAGGRVRVRHHPSTRPLQRAQYGNVKYAACNMEREPRYNAAMHNVRQLLRPAVTAVRNARGILQHVKCSHAPCTMHHATTGLGRHATCSMQRSTSQMQ